MGILNVTPDSFSDGGQYFDRDRAIARGEEIEQEGADIIDIGGESSRPGSEADSGRGRNTARRCRSSKASAQAVRIPISIDTYRSGVARRAIEAGAQIVNDISGFRFDARMPRSCAMTLAAGVVLMHSRGDRETLAQAAADGGSDWLKSRQVLQIAVRRRVTAGIAAESIVVDPGIGFGKAAEESVTILKSLEVFSKIGYPLLVGTSRKSFIRTAYFRSDQEARIWGTAATVVAAIMNGAHIVRVHDVRQTRSARGRNGPSFRLKDDMLEFYLHTARLTWIAALDILIVAFLIYQLLVFIKGTRAVQMAVGLGLIDRLLLFLALGPARNGLLDADEHPSLFRLRHHRHLSA